MSTLLKQFHDDEHMKNAVAEYLVECLREEALSRVFKTKKSTEYLADAGEVIKKAFAKLNDEYGVERTRGTSNRAL